jgi:hypothetical protein
VEGGRVNTTTKARFRPHIYLASCYACPFETSGQSADAVNMALIAHDCLPDPLDPNWPAWLKDHGLPTSDPDVAA